MNFIKSLFVWALLSCVSINVAHAQNLVNPYLFGGIQSIDAIPSIRVPVGTSFSSINFSDYGFNKVSALYKNGVISDVYITWFAGTYNSAVAGTYTVYGSLLDVNPNGIVPSISITVVTLETEYQTLLTRGTTLGYTIPTPICQGEENRLMITIKTLSLNVFYNFMTDGDSDYATLNWIAPSSNQATKVSSPTFTSKVGFTGNGTSSYVNTNFNPATQGGSIFTQNNSGFGGYAYTEGTGGYLIGQVATGARNSITAGGESSTLDINDNTVQSVTNYNGKGFYHAYRINSTQVNLYKNSCFLTAALTGNSVARPSTNFYLLARNNAGTADTFDGGTISCFWAGAANNSSITAFYDAWLSLMKVIRPKPTFSTPAAIGTLFTDQFARATIGNNYTTAGTWTMAGSNMTITGGTNTFTLRCRRRWGNSYQNTTTSVTCTLTVAPSGTTYGMGIGWSDFVTPSQERSIAIKLDMTSGANKGKLFIYTWDGTTGVSVGSASTALSVSSGDSFTIAVTKVISGGNMTYTAVATRLADNSTCTSTYSSFLGDSSGEFSLFNFGGSLTVTDFTTTVNEKRDEKILVVGNSLTYGAFATTITQGYAYNINSSYNVSAGPGDYTNEVIRKLRSIIDLNPKYTLVMIGGNDVAGGVTVGTYENYHKQIIYSLLNEGHKVIILKVAPRNDGDVTTLNAFIDSNYTGTFAVSGVVDSYTLLVGTGTNLSATYDYGDNVHWNQAGHTLQASNVVSALPVLY